MYSKCNSGSTTRLGDAPFKGQKHINIGIKHKFQSKELVFGPGPVGSALPGLEDAPLPDIFTLLHAREVLAVAMTSKALQREAITSCAPIYIKKVVELRNLRRHALWERILHL